MSKVNFDFLCAYLGITNEQKKRLIAINIPLEKVYESLFYNDEDKFFELLDSTYPNNYEVVLYLYLDYTMKLYELYKENNISDEIYLDTISDIKIWILECEKETGLFGLKEKYWINEHLHMRLFRLGRLQFQKVKYNKNQFNFDINANYNFDLEDKDVFMVHIPKGESLTYNDVIQSFNLALDFYHCDCLDLFCESWLLSPELTNILNTEANIIKFAKMFKLLYVDKESESIYRYLEKESKLFESVKKYEANGKKIGLGVGYLKYYKGDEYY